MTFKHILFVSVKTALINTFSKVCDNLRHLGIMHFSTSAISALHIDPSREGIFIMRSRLLVPKPQVVLHGSHSSHSVITQLLGAAEMTKPLDTSLLFNEFAINNKL